MMNKSWRFPMQYFLPVYAFGVVLCPTLQIFGKSVYAAEWMLLPLLVWTAAQLFRGKGVAPPRSLVWVWGALLAALLSGQFRGTLSLDLSRYQSLMDPNKELFNWSQDGIRFIRWLLLFSLPWLFSHVPQGEQNASEHRSDLFLIWIRRFIFISACMTVLEYLGWVDLNRIYSRQEQPSWWDGRSFGTFASPLEASLMYGLQIASLIGLISRPNETRQPLWLALNGVICIVALIATQGGTAFLALAICIAIHVYRNSAAKVQKLAITSSLLFLCWALANVPGDWLLWKFRSLEVRSRTWTGWLEYVPSKPWLGITGSGFSGLTVDNSLVLMLITGGVCLMTTLVFWGVPLFKKSLARQPSMMLFWIFSWFTLDSIGYWGIGRALWVYASLVYCESFLRVGKSLEEPSGEAERTQTHLQYELS